MDSDAPDASSAPEQLVLFDLSRYERHNASLWCEVPAAQSDAPDASSVGLKLEKLL